MIYKKKSWFKYTEFDFTPRFYNYYEILYGVGFKEHIQYVGFSYTHTPEKIGFYTSAFIGVSSFSFSLLAGPVYNFKLNDDGTSWQSYLGFGATFDGSLLFATQME